MRRIRSKNPRAVQLRIFTCLSCGTKVPASKRTSKTLPGHIKTMWCHVCKERKDMVQE